MCKKYPLLYSFKSDFKFSSFQDGKKEPLSFMPHPQLTSQNSTSWDVQKQCKTTSSDLATVSTGIHSVHSCSGLSEIRDLPPAHSHWGMGIFAEAAKSPSHLR